jgi:hypothetical protein
MLLKYTETLAYKIYWHNYQLPQCTFQVTTINNGSSTMQTVRVFLQ